MLQRQISGSLSGLLNQVMISIAFQIFVQKLFFLNPISKERGQPFNGGSQGIEKSFPSNPQRQFASSMVEVTMLSPRI